MTQPRQRVWRDTCSSCSRFHSQSPTHTHTPQGCRKYRLRTPGEITPQGPPSTEAASSAYVCRWQGKTAERVPQRASDLMVSEGAPSVLPGAQCLQPLLWLGTRGWDPQAHEDHEASPFDAHLASPQLVGAFLIRARKSSRPVLACEAATASCLRKCLQVLCPSTEFFPLGTVPLFHKMLCIRPLPSGPVSSILWLL